MGFSEVYSNLSSKTNELVVKSFSGPVDRRTVNNAEAQPALAIFIQVHEATFQFKPLMVEGDSSCAARCATGTGIYWNAKALREYLQRVKISHSTSSDFLHPDRSYK